MKKHLLQCSLASFLMFAGTPCFADIAVIVNPGIGVDSLSQDEVTRLFLGKAKSFPNQKSAVTVAHTEGSPTRTEFDKTVLKKSPNQMKAYWSQLVFTGRATPPAEFGSDAEIRKLVAENPNMIGYVKSDQVDASVKTVFLVK